MRGEYGKDRGFRTQAIELGEGLEDAREKGVNEESEGFETRLRNIHGIGLLQHQQNQVSFKKKGVFFGIEGNGAYYEAKTSIPQPWLKWIIPSPLLTPYSYHFFEN